MSGRRERKKMDAPREAENDMITKAEWPGSGVALIPDFLEISWSLKFHKDPKPIHPIY